MKNALEININSPIFAPMLKAIDNEIKRVVEEIYDEEFESGEISLRLYLSFPEDFKTFPRKDDEGFNDSELYYFRKPFFKHTITSSLKKQYKNEGTYAEEKEVKLVGDEYLLVPVTEPQISMLEDYEDFLG